MRKINPFVLLFIILSSLVIFSQVSDTNKYAVTFFVIADTHFDPPPESDQYYHTLAMNTICGTIKHKIASMWPEEINGVETNFGKKGENIDIPNGVIMAGDITDRADPAALKLLKSRYEKGEGDKVINFPVYVGLGNHDLDPQHVGENAELYKKNMLNYVAQRHNGKDAPVPVTNFDDNSKNYSWDWENIHLVQTHRFTGDIENGQMSSIKWLKEDLKKYASDGRPVVIIQHYGFDEWALSWTTKEQRNEYKETLEGYNVVAIFAGHNHEALHLNWEGYDVFQSNNAWPDRDGNGSFMICRITDSYLDVVTCRWKNGKGDVEFVSPFYHKEF
jgi:cytolysin (calcineurin-like family phosphatase)